MIFRELTTQEKILMFLNSMGAIEPTKGKSIEELSFALNEDQTKIREAIEILLQNGYVGKINGNYYLTEKGIIRLMRSFS